MNNLVIVESPTKARTLSRFLGSKYQIEASMGHIRDLPKSELGVDIENNFEPKYIIPRDKKKKVNELKKVAVKADQIWLATDPDREGEAIAWHIAEILKIEGGKSKIDNKKSKNSSTIHPLPSIQRVVFHEITEGAIKEAFEHPREIDLKLVDAQQARRVLDRLVGYKLSPLLWKKIKGGLSAGRVQSVALRLIVEREREIQKFVAIEYWSIEAELISDTAAGEKDRSPNTEASDQDRPKDGRFIATLIELNGEKLELKDQKNSQEHLNNLEKASYSVAKVTVKQVKRSAPPPFTTSTLQQTAGNKLGFTAKKTMMLAQNLYEQGFITYMRTDSFNLSPVALTAAREFISKNFGKNYLPDKAKVFKSKSKNAQEAHEAIRPAEVKVLSESLKSQAELTNDHLRLYDLIWKRMVASQIADAILDQTSVDVTAPVGSNNTRGPVGLHPRPMSSLEAVAAGTRRGAPKPATPHSDSENVYTLRASGSTLKFDGWLKVYGVRQIIEEEEEEGKEKKQLLPKLEDGENLNLLNLLPEQHFTQPPARFSESTLIKKLEELGIGRPSTYAPTLSTIQERFYVERVERRFIPTALGFTVNDFLIKYFPDVFDYEFTASMEDELDEISRGERQWKETIKKFYEPFEDKLEKTAEEAEHVKLEIELTDKDCPTCGKKLIVKTGRFGKFLACSGFPECKYTERIEEKLNAKCPQDGGDIVVRKTRKGRTFYGCKNYPNCKYASWTKPKQDGET